LPRIVGAPVQVLPLQVTLADEAVALSMVIPLVLATIVVPFSRAVAELVLNPPAPPPVTTICVSQRLDTHEDMIMLVVSAKKPERYSISPPGCPLASMLALTWLKRNPLSVLFENWF
jgi:hypothetical protein